MSSPSPLVAAQVIARNIVPLAGIVFLGWNAQNVLIVYFADTMLTLAVLFAGVLRHFAPPIENDGWAARMNGEVGMIGGGVFLMPSSQCRSGFRCCSCSADVSTGARC